MKTQASVRESAKQLSQSLSLRASMSLVALALVATGCGDATEVNVENDVENTATAEGALQYCTVLTFDNAPSGPVYSYVENGIEVTSYNPTPLYFDQGRLQNWQADPSVQSIFRFRPIDNELFTLYSVDVHNVVGNHAFYGGRSDASSNGGATPAAMFFNQTANGTTLEFPSGMGWDYLQNLTWPVFPTSSQTNGTASIDNMVLCHSPRFVHYGSDTNTKPDEATALPGGGEYYIGHLGRGVDLSKSGTNKACWVVRENGTEYNTGDTITTQLPCQFDVASAERVGRDMTHAYWWLWGPSERAKIGSRGVTQALRDAARLYGQQQATALIQQVNRYSTLVHGNTLFADIEGASNWYGCTGGSCPASNVLNQDLLEAFMETISSNGYQPGLYTNNSTWWQLFASDFVPKFRDNAVPGTRIPFVLWIASCNALCAYGTDPAAAALVRGSAFDATIAGAKPVLWQFYGAPASCASGGTGPAADFVMSEVNPLGGFLPRMAAIDHVPTTQFCSADQ